MEGFRFLVKAENGQVLNTSFKTSEEAKKFVEGLKNIYPNDTFKIEKYVSGEYGRD
jgi:viroplasmin and RNaseH domain-containing protein